MEKICSNCKFWSRKTKFQGSGNPEIPLPQGDCSHSAFVYSCDSETPENGLGYWDAEAYSAGFETGQKFGCIHWEPK